MKTSNIIIVAACFLMVFLIAPAFGGSAAFKDNIYDPGKLKPIDSKLNDINKRPDRAYCAANLEKMHK